MKRIHQCPRALASILALVLVVVLTAAPASAQVLQVAFKNLQNAAASGLMVEFDVDDCEVGVTDGGPFEANAGSRGNLRLYRGQVAPGGVARLLLRHNCSSAPTLDRWWWTEVDGDVMGGRKAGPSPEDVVSSSLIERAGYQTLTFTVAFGDLVLYLPLDMGPGESASGTLRLLPAGDSERQRSRNLESLRGYRLDIAGQPVSTAGLSLFPAGRWVGTIPAEARFQVPVDLWNAEGTQLGANVAPVLEVVPAAVTGAEVPARIQAEAPFSMRGPFDGDLTTTKVTVGGTTLQLLAESPRHLLALAPRSPLGSQEIYIEDGALRATGPLRNVAVNLTLADRDIEPGEELTLPLNLLGLSGLNAPLGVQITHVSHTAADLLPDRQRQLTMTLQPSEVTGDSYSTALKVQGTRGGRLQIEVLLWDLAAPAQ